MWFDYISEYDNEFASVRLDNKWNHIDTKGKLLSNQWFDNVNHFNFSGYAPVELNNKMNYINTEGNLVSKQWICKN